MFAPDDHRHGTYHLYTSGCRCDDCRRVASAAHRELRRQRGPAPSELAHVRAKSKAAQWVKANHPDAWQSLLNDAYRDLGLERKPPGGPRRTPPPKQKRSNPS